MRYDILFSDLDGTALGGDADLSPENSAAIDTLQERGVLFVPATGRTLGEVPRAVREHPAIRYFITSNGAAIYDRESGCFIKTNGIRGEKLTFISTLLGRYAVLRNVHKDGVSYFDKQAYENYAYYRMTDYYRECLYDCTEHTDDLDGLLATAGEVEMFSLFFKYDEELEDCKRQLEEAGGFQITASCEHALEVIAAGVSKGAALQQLAARVGVPTERTLAMGDSKNDMAMLEAAGLSLAVSNAVEELKQQADRVICHHAEHAIAYALSHFF